MSELEQWTRAAFGLHERTDVVILEQQEDTTGQSPNTVVEFTGPDGPQHHHLHLAKADITPAHLWQLAAGDDNCCR